MNAACGDESYRVTLCFPGTPQNATCTFSIQSGSAPELHSLQSLQGECPMANLFQHDCLSLRGAITVAFGPCTIDSEPVVRGQNNTLDVADWMNVLGLRKLRVC